MRVREKECKTTVVRAETYQEKQEAELEVAEVKIPTSIEGCCVWRE